MTHVRDAAATDDPQAIAACEVPAGYRAAVVLAADHQALAGSPVEDRDPRKTVQVQEVPTPEPDHGEVLIATMASSINYNTVWSALFEPVPTFRFLRTLGRTSPEAARHDQPYHVLGSDLSGVVLRTGPGVREWKPGDEVVAHCLQPDLQTPGGHDDTLLDPGQRVWGYETNFGGLAELSLVKANQLMPKPAHLTWEEAASLGVALSTAYRQLVSHHGAAMKQGERVLVWGAAGGVGAYATQLALNGGAVPICVVSSQAKADLCRQMGAELVIDRAAEGFSFWEGRDRPRLSEWSRFRGAVRSLAGDDPDIVIEHPGRDTFGVSVMIAARGGKVVTCASTTGYQHTYDNRHLWMRVKRIIGSHMANYREAWAANELVARGSIHPVLSRVYPLDATGDATHAVANNSHHGKVGVLCLADRPGMGVRDPELRARKLDSINLFRKGQPR
ncbi:MULTISPECIES: crotonyl-CoA carboxylase/reductase [Streptomyces]|uniref:AllR n=4 Tax=Streptomyces TaxID=1883 RepID=D6MYN9_9ACTN|nr:MULTISPECIES: crotonyl-CoA carboxylase/reductase [Streptomyces]ADU56308.1 crotonyl-CoA reductase [Streptomyces sp. KCTC 11604BP]ADX99510.1 FujC [Streptomyces sp. MJM7001]ADG39433.1 AllR [Streptomyces tsukubensis]AZK92748.1 crotonyl-CoA reductase [Streptomyces tsukubensis]EIF88211.1 crotonyl-CoA reductase [Streptomyces tsukubensis NRRL18488]